MIVPWFLLFFTVCIGASPQSTHKSTISNPEVVNIGAIFAFSTITGKISRIAMKAAEDDINSYNSFLGGRKLVISMHDSNYSGFSSIVGALKFMESEKVAIIGPQTSVMAHVLSHLANELHVPMLSFSALDPTLSPLQFPYLIQTAPNDLFQMTAIAETISYFGWREIIAFYTDDDQSRNGVSVLSDKLSSLRCRISYKAVIPPDLIVTREDIANQLVKVSLLESRIIVLNTFYKTGLLVFEVARSLKMMESGFVWIATSWLSTVVDSVSPLSYRTVNSIQGVLTFRPHTPGTKRNQVFSSSRWRKLSNYSIELNSYGLYAYDSVWIIANAMKRFFDAGGVISFSKDDSLSSLAGGSLNLSALRIFDGGEQILNYVIHTDMEGLTGRIRFDADRMPPHPSYDIINIVGTGHRRIGYWSNYSGLSVVVPEILLERPPNRSILNQKLQTVVWPGGVTVKPRGWVFSNKGRQLRIGVPNRVSFKDFVSFNRHTNTVEGYSIDVFLEALKLLPYAVPYRFIPFGDGIKNPSYSELVKQITLGVFDAVIGDTAATTGRTKITDFTQPYIESGLVVVAPLKKLSSSSWAFLQPFTLSMWGIIATFFMVVGAVVWALEHRINSEFRGPPKKQIATILWFSFSTLFFAHRENTMSTLGRIVLIIWLFVVLVVGSGYAASLTSILTARQLSSPIKGIETLISSQVPIGFQTGSFAENYMIEELNILKSRLIELGSPGDIASALEEGRVAAVVDEWAYMELFLSDHCKFSNVGQQFTKSGWGFAFERDSALAVDMSTAILMLSENGDLQKINDKWLRKKACNEEGSMAASNRLQLRSFWVLFLACGLACTGALFLYLYTIIRQFKRQGSERCDDPSGFGSSHLRSFLSFADGRADRDHSVPKRKRLEASPCSDDDEVETGSSKGTKRRETYADHTLVKSGAPVVL